MGTFAGRRWSKDQLAALWVEEGGPPEVAYLMADIAYTESRGQERSVSSTGCKGLWQICPPPDDAFDPRANARYAIAKYRSSQGLGAWTRYNPAAARLVSQFRARPNKYRRQTARLQKAGLKELPGDLFPWLPGGKGDLDPLDKDRPEKLLEKGTEILGLDAVADALREVGNAIGVIAKFVAEIARKVADPETWLAAGKLMLGFILLTIGLKRMFTLAT